MLNKLLLLLKRLSNIETKPVKQTGLIIAQPGARDWKFNESGILGVERMPYGDWLPFVPTGEKQYSALGFDSMSCVTFSALNILEMWINYLLPTLSKDHLDYLKLFGFFDESGKFNASDNFTAVMSGTTPSGNTLVKVWESIRTQGIVSEKDFPFNTKSFTGFHDRKRISPYLESRAKKFLKFFDIQYEWVHFTNGSLMNSDVDVSLMRQALKQSPVHIAVAIPGTHAEVLLNYGPKTKTFFNSYEPYISTFDNVYNQIHYSMKAVVIAKQDVPSFPKIKAKFSSQLKKGNQSEEVMSLQKVLSYFGFMNVATGYFGEVTEEAVKQFQIFNGIEPVGEIGPKTRALLNSYFEVPMVNKTNAQKLYETALSCLNKDITPNDEVSDQVACAATVNAIYKKAFGVEIGGGASTKMMYESLKKDKRFIEVDMPYPGDIIISPTGYGNGKLSNGHVGIVGEFDKIMSNNSPTGLFTQNFSIANWIARYKDKGGFPVKYYRCV